jgi:serine phosphatase RsbU (regulator of sigma subunit)/Tfp pilus assembly protein PilF
MMKTITVILCLFITALHISAQDKTDSLRKVLLKNIHDTTRIKTLNELANEVSYVNPDTALIIARSALSLAENVSGSIRGRNQNSDVWFRLRMETAQALTILGTIFKEQADFEKALEHYKRALEICDDMKKQISDPAMLKAIEGQIAICHGKSGGVYRHQGNYTRALDHFFKSLKWSEETGNKLNTAVWLGNIGITHGEQGNPQKSLEYYLKALSVFQELKHETGIATANLNIAGAYHDLKNYDKALEYYEKALEAFTKKGHKIHIAPTLGNIGGLYYYKKDYPKALDYLSRALKMEEELGNKEGMGRHMCNIGAVYISTGNYSEAEKYNKNALAIALETGSPDDMKEAHKNLANLYTKTNKWQLAYQHHEKYTALKDSLFTMEKNKDATKREMTYEFEKKEAVAKAEQEKKDELTQKEIQRHTFQRNAFIGGFLLMMALAVVIFRSYRNKRKAHQIIAAQKQEVEHQRELVMEKNKEITDSIHYALRIQNALLATEDSLRENLRDYFVLFKPKDIVSGDFYWAVEHKRRFYLAICDSTGHGVPGAFMSLLNMGFLSEAVKEKDIVSPNEILDYVRRRLVETVSKGEQKDGMDGILLCLDHENGTLTYAAAHNSPVIITGRGLDVLKADKMPVGNSERYDPFELFTLPVSKGDSIYLFTDGYADQFGGPRGKKFKYKQLEELLLTNSVLPVEQQKDLLLHKFNEWKGLLEQVDDVCVVGFRL